MPNTLKYQEDFCRQAHQLCLMGATNKQLAEFFQVNEETIYRWQNEYPEFKDAVKSAKLIADAQVAEALFKRAIGFRHTDTKMFVSEGTILTEEYEKVYPPDTQACRWWLTNRQREIWAERQEIDVNLDGRAARMLAAKKRIKQGTDGTSDPE